MDVINSSPVSQPSSQISRRIGYSKQWANIEAERADGGGDAMDGDTMMR
jgi:hypothetical protein